MPTWQTIIVSVESRVWLWCHITMCCINDCIARSLIIKNTVIFLWSARNSDNIYAYYTDLCCFNSCIWNCWNSPSPHDISQHKLSFWFSIISATKAALQIPYWKFSILFSYVSVNSLHLLLVVSISVLCWWDACNTLMCYANMWTWIRPMRALG